MARGNELATAGDVQYIGQLLKDVGEGREAVEYYYKHAELAAMAAR